MTRLCLLLVCVATACGASPPTSRKPAPCPPSDTCEAVRISGKLWIDPEVDTQVAMAKVHVRKLIVALKACVGADGNVFKVLPVRSSGFPGYDRQVAAEIGRWKYQPFTVRGQPSVVCTSVTMIWTAK